MINEDYIFECRKCRYRIYTVEVDKLIDKACPNCGKEFYSNLIFVGKGVFRT